MYVTYESDFHFHMYVFKKSLLCINLVIWIKDDGTKHTHIQSNPLDLFHLFALLNQLRR